MSEDVAISVTVPRANSAAPNLPEIASFFARSRYFQLKRGIEEVLHPTGRLREGTLDDFPFVAAESVTPLLTDADARELPLLLGKVENLRLAVISIHGRVLAAGETFSFWRQVGPPWRSRGFVPGREVREGCVIPTIGGGLCQLSGSLLEAGMRAGLEVVERHGHTALPDDLVYRPERDATVFWNYVDLRLRARRSVFLEALVTDTELVVRMRGESEWLTKLPVLRELERPVKTLAASCYSCGQTQCLRHAGVKSIPEANGVRGKSLPSG